MMKTLSVGDLLSGMAMAWKQKYIWDNQWDELCWEFYSCCSMVCKYPVHTAAFLFCAPRLIKILVFFYPLVITTALFFLIIFSLGPQLERMKADWASRLERFREAVDDGVGGGSWVAQQTYGNLAMIEEVGMSVEWDGANWASWAKTPRGCHQSSPYTEEKVPNDSQTDDLNTVDFGTVAKEEAGQKEAWTVVFGKSLILGKLGDLMEKLIAELGGSVELGVLNALETITQVLIESTGRNYQKMAKITTLFNMESTENELSNARQFQTADLDGGCQSLTRSDSVASTDAETSNHVPGEGPSKELRDGAALVSCVEDSCAAETLDTSQDTENDNAALDGDRVPSSEPPVGVGLPVQEKLQRSDGLLRSCRSFPICALDGEYGNTDQLWKRDQTFGQQRTLVGQEKDWKAILDKQESWGTTVGEKFYGKQIEATWKLQGQFSSRSLAIPIQENLQCHIMAGKLRNSPLEPITFVKNPQFLTSPVMLMEAQDMDLLWEEYNDAPGKESTPGKESEPLIKDCNTNACKHRYPAETEDSDAEEDSAKTQVCCLSALKFSKNRLPLKKPNFMKFSKALKKLGLMRHFRDRKQSRC